MTELADSPADRPVQRWKPHSPAGAAHLRRGPVLLLLAAGLALTGAIAAWLSYPQPFEPPYFLGLWVDQHEGPVKYATLRLALGDPAELKKASVRGHVLEGDRPQADVPVRLYDVRAQQKGETRTNERGEFAFTKLDPGRYRITAAKTGSATRGQRDVELKEGEQKVLTPKEEVKLYR